MIRFLFIGILTIFIANNNGWAQHPYSQQNLNNASREEIDLLYNKALKIKKVGKAITIPGITLAGIGMAIGANGLARTFIDLEEHSNQMGTGGVMFTIGSVATIVGLPILITGISRKKRIDKIKDTTTDCFFFEVAPYGFYDCLAQQNQNGITLRLCF